jgi:cytoskeleton protein RodZ
MTELTESSTMAPHAPPAAAHAAFGAPLAAARERLGISIGEMASRLRLHPKQIEALERGNLHRLPAAPYVRGFLRNYARELKIDAQPLLDELDRQLGASAPDAARPDWIVARAHPPGDGRDWRRATLAGGIALLLVAGAIGFLLPRPHDLAGRPAARGAPTPERAPAQAEGDPASPTPAPAAADSAAGSAANPAADAATDSARAAAPGPATPAASAAASAPASPRVPAGAPGAAAATSASANSPGPGAAAAGRASGTLVLHVSERAWVEVTQGDGRVLISHTVEPGSVEVVTGMPPLRLVLGNSSGVVVDFRGRPVDLAPYSQGGVVRMTLQ